MEYLEIIIDFILNIDIHLQRIAVDYEGWVYLILFLVIFCETGLIVTPFLPGDSLLFAAGAIAALGVMNIWLLIALLCVAAILGDGVNYRIGKYIGTDVFKKNYRLINKKHLLKAESFYQLYGGKTIVIARFIPIVRTFAPFVAGIGKMDSTRFAIYNVLGAVLWVFTCSIAGYFFGNIPLIKENFSVVVLAIIGVSLIPIVVEFIRNKRS